MAEQVYVLYEVKDRKTLPRSVGVYRTMEAALEAARPILRSKMSEQDAAFKILDLYYNGGIDLSPQHTLMIGDARLC